MIITNHGSQFQSSFFTEFNHLQRVKDIRDYQKWDHRFVWQSFFDLSITEKHSKVRFGLFRSWICLLHTSFVARQYFPPNVNPIPMTNFVQELRQNGQTGIYFSATPTNRCIRLASTTILRIRFRKERCHHTGPFKVFNRAKKHLTTKLDNLTDTVSINRIKPVFIEKKIPQTTLHLTFNQIKWHPHPMYSQQQQQLQENKLFRDGR